MPEPSYRCDIILVTWNKLDYIKECVGSILRHADLRCRLIVVDNASDEETRRFLKDIRGNEMVDIKLIFNDSNLGPGKARNIALRQMDADYACFIDSDVVVTPHWLSNMAGLAENNPEVGMVNPSSNNFNQVPPEGVSLDEYSRSLAPLRNSYIEAGQCISFCMLIKSEVVKKIGFIDEEYILALYEDTDYSMKANKEGCRCVIAKGAYVWHHGHGSTRRVKKIEAIAKKNRERFYKKWGRPLRIVWCLGAGEKNKVVKEALTDCVELARDGNFVYFFMQEEGQRPPSEVFKENGLIEHANVHIIFYRGRHFEWFCLWRVLKRRKKSYDLAITDDKGIASLLRRFSFLYKARVLATVDFDEIINAAHSLKFK